MSQGSRERGARCWSHSTDRRGDRPRWPGGRCWERGRRRAVPRAGQAGGRPAVGTGPGPQPCPPREAWPPCLASSQGPTTRCRSASHGGPGKEPSGDSLEATWLGRWLGEPRPVAFPVLLAGHVLLRERGSSAARPGSGGCPHTSAVVPRPEAPAPHLSREACLSRGPGTVTCLPACPSQHTKTDGSCFLGPRVEPILGYPNSDGLPSPLPGHTTPRGPAWSVTRTEGPPAPLPTCGPWVLHPPFPSLWGPCCPLQGPPCLC